MTEICPIMASQMIARLRSQIGDDVQDVYLPSALYTLAADTIEGLMADISATLRREHDANVAAMNHLRRAEAAEARVAELDAHNTMIVALRDIEDKEFEQEVEKRKAAEAKLAEKEAEVDKLRKHLRLASEQLFQASNQIEDQSWSEAMEDFASRARAALQEVEK